jgi:hypothetical protein
LYSFELYPNNDAIFKKKLLPSHEIVLVLKNKIFFKKKMLVWLGMTSYGYNPSTQETDTRGSQVQGQPGLHSKILSERKGGRAGGVKRMEVCYIYAYVDSIMKPPV